MAFAQSTVQTSPEINTYAQNMLSCAFNLIFGKVRSRLVLHSRQIQKVTVLHNKMIRRDIENDCPLCLPGSSGRYQIVCNRLHLTYNSVLNLAPIDLIRFFDSVAKTRGLVVEIISVVVDDHSSTHVALDLRTAEPAAKFRLQTISIFSLCQVSPVIRLVKTKQTFDEIVGVLHPQLGSPVRRPVQGDDRVVPIQTPISADSQDALVPLSLSISVGADRKCSKEERRMKETALQKRREDALAAYEESKKANMIRVQEIIANLSADKKTGSLTWLCDVPDAIAVADYMFIAGKSITIHNQMVPEMVARILQRHANIGNRPPSVIFTLYVGEGPRIPYEDLSAFYRMCEQIRNGTLSPAKTTPLDCPMLTWRPAVFVYSDFYPNIDDPAFDVSRWTIALPGPECQIGHLLAGKKNIISSQFAASFAPNPKVVDLEKLKVALGNGSCSRLSSEGIEHQVLGLGSDNHQRIQSLYEAASALFRLFSPESLEKYFRAGYAPHICIIEMDIITNVYSPFGTFNLEADTDRNLVQDSYEILKTTNLTPDMYKMHLRIGKVVVRSIKLSQEDQERALAKLLQKEFPYNALELGNRYLVCNGLEPKDLESLARQSTRVPPYNYLESMLERSPPETPPVTKTKTEDEIIQEFLCRFRDSPIFSILENPIVPGTRDYTVRFLLRAFSENSVHVAVEFDKTPPTNYEIYKSLHVLRSGAKIVRVRLEDVQTSENWLDDLVRAVYSKAPMDFVYFSRSGEPHPWEMYVKMLQHLETKTYEEAFVILNTSQS